MRLATIMLAVLLTLGGCGGRKPEPVTGIESEPGINLPERLPYTLSVGDYLTVRFFYYPEYSVNVVIRPDGVVTIPLVGEVHAEGMRPSELENMIREKYTEVLAEPEVSVIVTEFADQRVFVFGEVRSPGGISLLGSMTILDAIASAGGVLATGQMDNVVLMRKTETGHYVGQKINVEKMLGSTAPENVYLMARDVIYVPMTAIGKVDVFVDQFFHKLTPAWRFYILGRQVLNPEGDFIIGQ